MSCAVKQGTIIILMQNGRIMEYLIYHSFLLKLNTQETCPHAKNITKCWLLGMVSVWCSQWMSLTLG